MPQPRKTVEERFWGKVNKNAPNGCWEWTAGLFGNGYGHFWTSVRWVGAHRWAYEALVGPIPEGLELDHLCSNRKCVNPAHLEPVTHKENTLRGEGLAAQNAKKQACPKCGSPYVIVGVKTQERVCKKCHLANSRRRQEKLLKTGICVQCCKRPLYTKWRCEECSLKQAFNSRRYYQKRKAATTLPLAA